ncbi:pRL2-23 [Streptomyces axinellae]|uniref:PRL2-23 n=1 Tax=Streptomyces axinellae TaxID=552788 RepID=A0ABP6DAF7_9ACTN
MTAAVIAVVGTLLGALVNSVMQQRARRLERAAEAADGRRTARIDAVTALSVAVSDHRRAMWAVRDAQITGQPDERATELRDESHRTRSAITEPAVRIRLLIRDQAVRTAAEAAIQATYVMRTAETTAELQRMRAAAVTAHDGLIDAAGRHLDL